MHKSVVALLLLLAALGARAAELPPPQGRVILSVEGMIDVPGGIARFDRALLEALPQREIITVTPWTDGPARFEGPLLREVLARVGAQGARLEARAINDYAVTIPVSDAERYDVILALRRDGQPLTVRSLGPLWVIYPWSEHPELATETYYGRAIWQLERIVVVR